MITVYILFSEAFEKYYVGVTTDFERRLKEHNKGKTKSTKPLIPWILVHKEEFITFAEARKREKYLKSAAGRRRRKKHLRPRTRPNVPKVVRYGRGSTGPGIYIS